MAVFLAVNFRSLYIFALWLYPPAAYISLHGELRDYEFFSASPLLLPPFLSSLFSPASTRPFSLKETLHPTPGISLLYISRVSHERDIENSLAREMTIRILRSKDGFFVLPPAPLILFCINKPLVKSRQTSSTSRVYFNIKSTPVDFLSFISYLSFAIG